MLINNRIVHNAFIIHKEKNSWKWCIHLMTPVIVMRNSYETTQLCFEVITFICEVKYRVYKVNKWGH